MDASNYNFMWSSNDSNVTSNEWCSTDCRPIFLGCNGGIVKKKKKKRRKFRYALYLLTIVVVVLSNLKRDSLF